MEFWLSGNDATATQKTKQEEVFLLMITIIVLNLTLVKTEAGIEVIKLLAVCSIVQLCVWVIVYVCCNSLVVVTSPKVSETPMEDSGTTKTKRKKEKKTTKEEKKRRKSKKDGGAPVVSKEDNSLMGLVELDESASAQPQASQQATSFKLLGEDEQISMVRERGREREREKERD